jgi:hypothetical protein
MANKLDNAIQAVKEALETLVSNGVLRSVKRGIIEPLTEIEQPVLAFAVSRVQRTGGPVAAREYTCEIALQLVCRRGEGDVDDPFLDVLGEVDACLDSLSVAGTAGAAIDAPVWDAWYVPQDEALVPVGAIGSLRIRVRGPLKV